MVIDSGRLLRTASLSSFTGRTGELVVETEEDAGPLAARLRQRGHAAEPTGRSLVVELPAYVADPNAVYDAVRDEAVALELSLVRVEQRRHQLEDLFREADSR